MQKLYILDASGYLHRSYHAIREMTNSKGESTNALFGFIRSVLKLIKDFEPTYLISVFDGPNNKTKRTALYPDYKLHRKETPKDLLYQILWAQKFCQLIGIPEIMVSSVEADDTMASIALWAEKNEIISYLCTSDKDMCQLVNDRIFILNTFKENLIMGSAEVEQQFGVTPLQMADYLAIVGDPSDNVPGLTGFGPKTASTLLKKYGTLDYILDHPNIISGEKKQEILVNEREKVLLSRTLVTVLTDVPCPQILESYKIKEPNKEQLREFYTIMNFSSLLREIQESASSSQPNIGLEKVHYTLVDNLEVLKNLLETLSSQKEICIDTETSSLHPMEARLVGIGFGFMPGQAWYVPLNGKIDRQIILSLLKPLFENPNIGFYGHNLKYDYHVLANENIILLNICFDTMLASYLLNSHNRKHSLDHLSLEIFNKNKIPIEQLIGKGKSQINMNEVPCELVSTYCCEDVDYTVRLKNQFEPELLRRKLNHLFYDLELPLLPILADMERAGIYIDVSSLKKIEIEIRQEIESLEESIYETAGEKFNLNSPKQLASILFDKLKIVPTKKIASGFSTNVDVLEKLKYSFPIAQKLLEYRSLEKLRSTYIQALPLHVNPFTQRIHCHFNQSVAATGRLSCQDPNLQNIPVRTPIGLKIRESFKPQLAGWSYLSADYSQIELRLLAHLSNDPILLEAFNSNEDIHAFTASQLFHIPLKDVTKEQRNQAKTVNFGIMYGQQAFGLSQELGIDVKEAGLFIKTYFDRYQKVKEFIEMSKLKARETGKATSLFGRERLIPEINSSNGINRSMAERLAVNTPLQGTQADLIKLAMLEIKKKFIQNQFKAYMVLQIHDELIFEIPDSELIKASEVIHDAMIGVAQLKVPLIVNIHIGKNWKEC